MEILFKAMVILVEMWRYRVFRWTLVVMNRHIGKNINHILCSHHITILRCGTIFAFEHREYFTKWLLVMFQLPLPTVIAYLTDIIFVNVNKCCIFIIFCHLFDCFNDSLSRADIFPCILESNFASPNAMTLGIIVSMLLHFYTIFSEWLTTFSNYNNN